MAEQMAFYMDTRACTGCKSCELACKDKNNLGLGLRWRRVRDYGGGAWVEEGGLMVPKGVFSYHISWACMHCLRPACVEVCPVGAIHKGSNGIVVIDQAACVGCRSCETACPYGAPQFDEKKGVMTKCDFCRDLIDRGLQPACVSICPQRCLDWGELAQLQARHGSVQAIEPLPRAEKTLPAVVITPHRDAQESGRGTGRLLTRFES